MSDKPEQRCEHGMPVGTSEACPECPPPSELAPASGSAPTLMGHWRHSHGLIFCGTLRIAREDFDTNPHPDFRDKVFDEICAAMNRAQNDQAEAQPPKTND